MHSCKCKNGHQDEIQGGIPCLKMVWLVVYKNRAFLVPGEEKDEVAVRKTGPWEANFFSLTPIQKWSPG